MIELKPCPMCGQVELTATEFGGHVECLRCGTSTYTHEEWNNAWAHIRIAELEGVVDALVQEVWSID